MNIEVEWTWLRDDKDPLWWESFCLYAYAHPDRNWVLYIGKADFATVRQRARARDKDEIYRAIRKRYGVYGDELRVLHGDLILPEGRRRSSELLADVESLLIKRLQPFANVQCREGRISRPGMRIRCSGGWPYKRSGFHDT